jgi:hypothetical protein
MRVMVGDCRIGFTERLLEARVMAVIETCNYGRVPLIIEEHGRNNK